MSDIKQAKRKLDICGYVHPTKIISSKDKKYMTFDTENTEKKSYNSSTKYSEYATFTDKDSKKSLNKLYMSCPECGETALYVCNCKYKDKQCGKGHVWYINSQKQIVKGDPHS